MATSRAVLDSRPDMIKRARPLSNTPLSKTPLSKTARSLLVAACAALACVLVLAVTGFFGPTVYDTGERRITVAVGDEFTLEVPARPSIGEHWYLAGPRPDAGVLGYRGTHEEIEGTEEGIAGGGDGTAYFDFTARGKGTTTVTLLHCPMARCGGAARTTATASPVPTAGATEQPGDEPAFFRYEITVR
ncbi:protease inhibitor I42 family protein [Streptomyces sp. NPDC093546]|uniref:protease inhibitor I42 family protein n=1 Tax=Streptomyces sp. NPDC093546 TaxID=3366040 RepID=UPI00380EB6A7